ncbi:MAG: hypothetical protein HS099_08945 [Ardenticatenaceae bacterium]|nr:hypothetical protein [Ardenticatenaceae bacterium]
MKGELLVSVDVVRVKEGVVIFLTGILRPFHVSPTIHMSTKRHRLQQFSIYQEPAIKIAPTESKAHPSTGSGQALLSVGADLSAAASQIENCCTGPQFVPLLANGAIFKVQCTLEMRSI